MRSTLLAVLLAGCVLSPVDLGDKACPCAAGYRCNEATQRCVAGAPDAGGTGSCAAPVLFDATPYTGAGFVCRSASATAIDGQSAGLDSPGPMSSLVSFDAHAVEGCIGYDLGAPHAVASVQIWLAATGDACGATPCVVGSNGCGSGDTAAVFWGVARGDYHFLSLIRPSATLAEYTVPVAEVAQLIVVCREAWSSDRDDVIVDALSATCE